MRISLFLSSIASITVVALSAPGALAQTPDGETPEVETVCDPLKGGTPSLYGLCVSFCEAQDCDDDAVAPAECQAANPGDAFGHHKCSCAKVLANYDARRAPGDPEMPCIVDACPCFDADFLATELLNGNQCTDSATARRLQTLANGTDAQGCNAVAQTFIKIDAEGIRQPSYARHLIGIEMRPRIYALLRSIPCSQLLSKSLRRVRRSRRVHRGSRSDM